MQDLTISATQQLSDAGHIAEMFDAAEQQTQSASLSRN